MTNPTSSPFVESPSIQNDVLKDYATDTSKLDSKIHVSKLEFQIQTLKTEKELWAKERRSIVSQYEDNIKQKNKEIEELKLNIDFVYKENEQLGSKFDNSSDISQVRLNELNQKYKDLKSRNSKLESDYRSLVDKNDRLIRKHKQVTADWNTQIKVNDELSNELKVRDQAIQTLQESNEELVAKSEQYTELFKNDESLFKNNQILMNKNTSLQKTNNQLQLKIDQLLQKSTSIELLKQKNMSLSKTQDQLEELKCKYQKLEVEKLEIEAKYNDYFQNLERTIVDDDNYNPEEPEVTKSLKVQNFIDKFRELQAQNLALKEKYDAKTMESNELKQELEDVSRSIEQEYLPLIQKGQAKNEDSSYRISELEREKTLFTAEIEHLRKSLKDLEEILNSRDESKHQNNTMQQYITNLENLVDQYKRKLDEQSKMSVSTAPQIGEKRQRSEDKSFRQTATDLEKENMHLLSTVKKLELSNSQLKQKLGSLELIKQKQESYKVLELKNSLLSKDQFVKRATLDTLRKENEALIDRYVNHRPSTDLIPKALFARQEDDKAALQSQVDVLTKRISRLRDVYTQKSRDILITISRYFGYSIEFLPSTIRPDELSSRLKLSSKLIPKDKNSYLILDIDNKSLKAFGDYEFKSLCEELANEWVSKNQFPCMLSALNLKLYEAAKST
ncbi:Mad1 protein [Candida orthopsilosis Co 90-125]|uniref:Spindle assembly checkpoint component MAD1 n=1 Tax=Candida orthopsilosis (strain 90-125) TaxID=1136231 RepID=H8X4T0_CANO9|nr:Mad1 protein [Candida orthopsilosis Co 90-125]CCG23022.1 Mad1 protein [Candida orthopsilosis Co 90-125]